jgi:hypothetical protein
MRLSEQMWQALELIASIERDGWLGADPDLIPQGTYLALSRRGLIEPNEDGSVRLSERGKALTDKSS